MHISRTRRHYLVASGIERVYDLHLLARSVRVGETPGSRGSVTTGDCSALLRASEGSVGASC